MSGKSKKNPVILGFALFFMCVSLFTLYKISQQGTFQETSHRDLLCRPLFSIKGPESFLMTREGKLLVSSQDRQASLYGKSWPQGHILLADPAYGETPAVNLTENFKGEFHPRGISLYEDKHGKTLFVVNYLTGGFRIEVFSLNGNRLQHLRSLKSRQLIQPGSIAARDHHSFYVMNEHGLFTASGHFIEEFLGLRASHVLLYNGSGFAKVVDDLRLGYGLSFDPGQKRIYLTDMKDENIQILEHSRLTERPVLLKSIPLETHPAGISPDPEGKEIWLTAHPQLMQANSHMLDPANVNAPSQVLNLNPDAASPPDEVLLSLKSGTSAASAVVRWKNSLILGGAFDRQMSLCALPSPVLTQQ